MKKPEKCHECHYYRKNPFDYPCRECQHLITLQNHFITQKEWEKFIRGTEDDND